MRSGVFKSIMLLSLLISLSACSKSNSTKPTGTDEPAIQFRESKTCDDFLKKFPKEKYEYAWIHVPEDYTHPEISPKIKIFYWKEKGNFKNYVAFFQGGPGSSSHWQNLGFEQSFEKFAIDKSEVGFVYIDHRGTGCSSHYPKFKNNNNLVKRYRFYGSTGIVHDAEAIRKKLIGNRKWRIFGQSYGAFIVHRYVALFPDSVDLALAHGNAINSDAIERKRFRTYASHLMFQEYLSEDKGALRPQWKLLLEKANRRLYCLKDKYGVENCGFETLSWVSGLLGFKDYWEKLSNWIRKIVQPDSFVNETELLNAMQKYADKPNTDAQTDSWAFSVIAYYDRNVTDTSYAVCSEVYSRIQRIEKVDIYHLESNARTMTECSSSMQFQYAGKRRKYVIELFGENTDILTMDNFEKGLDRLGRNKFYLYSGAKDAFIPPATFDEELSAVGDKLTYRAFTQTGHDGFYTEPQVLKDLVQ